MDGTLEGHLRELAKASGKAEGFDRAVRAHVSGLPLDWEVLAIVVEDLLRGVQEEWEDDARCKERKHYHRAWVRGFVAACMERGMEPEQALVPLAHLSLLTSYDEGIMLHVFASSLGYGIGQAWAAVSRDEGARKRWLEAMRHGLKEGYKTLADENEELDPELMVPEARVLSAAEHGMNTASFLGAFKRPF